MSYEIDWDKARILTINIAKVNKRINYRRDAFKKIHEEIKEIKKISSKATRGRIAKLETNILEALKEGGLIVDETQHDSKGIIQLSNNTEQSREERIRAIENAALQKAELIENKSSEMSALRKSIITLENVRKNIKVKGRDEKEKLQSIISKINYLKQKISEMSGKKPLPKKQAKKSKKNRAKKR